MTKLEQIMSSWNRLGATFGVPPAAVTPDVERLLIDTAELLPQSVRLYPAVLAWLVRYEKLVCSHRLSALALEVDDQVQSAVLGCLLSLAGLRARTRHYRVAVDACRALESPRPLFKAQATSSALMRAADASAVPAGREWGLWVADDAIHTDGLRSANWIMEQNPRLRLRALLGGRLAASILATLEADPEAGSSESGLARATNVTRIAVRDALDHLELCLLVTRHRQGRSVRVELVR